jgi:SRSO17 transposase
MAHRAGERAATARIVPPLAVTVDPDGQTVAAWARDLDALLARLAPYFPRTEPRRQVAAYLHGLLSPVERKNGWQMAEAAGETTPYAMQHLLGRAVWDAEAVRDEVRMYVVEHLGAAEAVLVVDETGFLKKGTHSVGVARQYSGTAGRIENCQIGVFLAYASPRGRAFLDRALYLPRDWAEDAGRREAAGVPPDIAFRTKPHLARAMLEGAFDAGVPAAWVTGDEVYGGDRRLRVWLEDRRVAHVLAVKCTEPLWAATARGPAQVTAAALAAGALAAAWQRLSAGDGAKGPRRFDWVRVAIRPLADPDWDYWLLARRSLSDASDLAYYVCFAPAGTILAELVRIAGMRWTIEDGFAAAKGEVGLDHYEVRRWDGWHRHVTLCLLALAFLVTTQTRANAVGRPPPSRSSLAAFRARRGLAYG